jgi:hypothetical protein
MVRNIYPIGAMIYRHGFLVIYWMRLLIAELCKHKSGQLFPELKQICKHKSGQLFPELKQINGYYDGISHWFRQRLTKVGINERRKSLYSCLGSLHTCRNRMARAGSAVCVSRPIPRPGWSRLARRRAAPVMRRATC